MNTLIEYTSFDNDKIQNLFKIHELNAVLSYRLLLNENISSIVEQIKKSNIYNKMFEKVYKDRKIDTATDYECLELYCMYNFLKKEFNSSSNKFKTFINFNKQKNILINKKKVYDEYYDEIDADKIYKNIIEKECGSKVVYQSVLNKLKQSSFSKLFKNIDGTDGDNVIYYYFFNYTYELLQYDTNKFNFAFSILKKSKSNEDTFETLLKNYLSNSSSQYYSHKQDASLISGMRWFHNRVKELAISMCAKKFDYNISLLDTAGGQGGDIQKWQKVNIKDVLFIEYDAQNINNKIDGAKQRYKELNSSNLNITFINGDSRKIYSNGDAGVYFGDKLKLKEYYRQHSLNNFEIISCQFAIHYFFESKETITNFITNIEENLKDNGYFICTVLCGKTIFEELSRRENIKGTKKNKIIWDIKKEYSDTNFKKYGQKINVYNINIGNYIPEYLVNIKYLTKKLKEKGIKLCANEIFTEKLFNLFNPSNMIDDEIKYSSLHRLLIFKKSDVVENINIEDYKLSMNIEEYTFIPEILNPDNQCLVHNIHVRQNRDAEFKTADDFYSAIYDDMPTLEYQKTSADKMRTTIHNGQRKLLMTEIEFLTLKYENNKNNIMIYAGAAPGTHIAYLSSLFPNVTFILVDPNNFTVTETDKIKIRQEYFTDDLAKQLREKYVNDDNNVLFCSDIRRANPELMNPQEVEETVVEDMKMQIEWVRQLTPNWAMLKFRLPYDYYKRKNDDDKDLYPDGLVMIQPWAPLSSTETRLIFDGKNIELIEYDNIKYQNQMFWHNNVGRVNCYDTGYEHDPENGLDHCWDCTREFYILMEYLKLKNNNNNVTNEEICELSREISKELKSNIKYPMKREGIMKKKEIINMKSKVRDHRK